MPARPRQAKIGSRADHLRAVADTNVLLAALGECWRLANDGLRGEITAKALAEALVRIKAEADQAVRKVMTPVHSPHDGGWYLEEAKFSQGRWQQRHSKQVWATAEEAGRALLNKRVRFERFL